MRALIIDDHELYRRGLRMLLCEANPGAQISEASSLEQALTQDMQQPKLVLLDIKLPGMSGLEGIAMLKRRWPDVTIVMLSALDTAEARAEALSSGAVGYISKSECSDCFLACIAVAMHGGQGAATAPSCHGSHLTPRQREVIRLLCQGLSNKLIARELVLSENTVRRHVQDILEYLQVNSRTEAMFAAQRRGLVP